MTICPHCGKEFDERQKPKGKWYFTNGGVIISLLCAGPFALPAVWFNPNYKKLTKWLLTIIVLIVTALLTILLIELIAILIRQFRTLMQMAS